MNSRLSLAGGLPALSHRHTYDRRICRKPTVTDRLGAGQVKVLKLFSRVAGIGFDLGRCVLADSTCFIR